MGRDEMPSSSEISMLDRRGNGVDGGGLWTRQMMLVMRWSSCF